MKSKETLYIYTRVSTAEQADKDLSLPRQEELGRKMASELGMEPVVYTEAGESASQENFDNRPQLQALLGLVQEGIAKHIFVFDQSRLSRNDITKAILTTALRKQKANLYTHSKKFDFNKPEDILCFSFIESMEAYESFMRKSRFQLGYVSANKKGRYLKNNPPFGYRKDEKGFLVIDEEEKRVFLQIVDLYLKGYGTNKIADFLNQKGIPTKTSKVLKNGYTLKKGVANRKSDNHKKVNEWNPGSVNCMLKSEIYLGARKFKVAENTFESVACEPIIDKATFDKIQKVRLTNAITRKKQDKYFYLLKNLCVCSCGQPMHGRVKPNRGEYTYRCNSRRNKNSSCQSRAINIYKLNDIVWNAFRTSSLYHKLINEKMLLHLNDDDALEKRLAVLQNELSEIERQGIACDTKLKKIIKRELDSRISRKVYDEIVDEIQAEAKAIANNKAACQANLKFVSQQLQLKKNPAPQTSKEFHAFKGSLKDIRNLRLPKKKEDEVAARQLLQEVISNIKVTYCLKEQKHVVEITFNEVGLKWEQNSKAGYSFKHIPGKTVEVSAKEKSRHIELPTVSPQYFLNSHQGPNEKEQLLTMQWNVKASSKKLPPFHVGQKMWH